MTTRDLVDVSPFGSYVEGDLISDADAVAAIVGCDEVHFAVPVAAAVTSGLLLLMSGAPLALVSGNFLALD